MTLGKFCFIPKQLMFVVDLFEMLRSQLAGRFLCCSPELNYLNLMLFFKCYVN